MKRDPKNILHDWKAARMERSYLSQVEFLGSGIRVSFLRAWLVTAIKVMLIFSFMNFHVDVAAKMEENIVLMDKLIHDDFAVDLSYMRVAKVRTASPKMAEVANLPEKTQSSVLATGPIEPRGPSPSVAGDSITIPD